MAHATRTAKEYVYTLQLTQQEAYTLAAILSNVSGSDTDSPRQHVDSIDQALSAVLPIAHDEAVEYSLISGKINFDNY